MAGYLKINKRIFENFLELFDYDRYKQEQWRAFVFNFQEAILKNQEFFTEFVLMSGNDITVSTVLNFMENVDFYGVNNQCALLTQPRTSEELMMESSSKASTQTPKAITMKNDASFKAVFATIPTLSKEASKLRSAAGCDKARKLTQLPTRVTSWKGSHSTRANKVSLTTLTDNMKREMAGRSANVISSKRPKGYSKKTSASPSPSKVKEQVFKVNFRYLSESSSSGNENDDTSGHSSIPNVNLWPSRSNASPDPDYEPMSTSDSDEPVPISKATLRQRSKKKGNSKKASTSPSPPKVKEQDFKVNFRYLSESSSSGNENDDTSGSSSIPNVNLRPSRSNDPDYEPMSTSDSDEPVPISKATLRQRSKKKKFVSDLKPSPQQKPFKTLPCADDVGDQTSKEHVEPNNKQNYHICCYCGARFKHRQLRKNHIQDVHLN